MGFSANWMEAILNHIFGGSALTQPTQLYVGLSAAAINGDYINIAEPSTDDGYSRYAVTHDQVTGWNVAAAENGDIVISNKEKIAFGPCANNGWGEVTHFFVTDTAGALSAANLVVDEALVTPRAINVGDSAEFDPGGLKIVLKRGVAA